MYTCTRHLPGLVEPCLPLGQKTPDTVYAILPLTPYADDPREKVAVGIIFDRERRRIGGWAAA